MNLTSCTRADELMAPGDYLEVCPLLLDHDACSKRRPLLHCFVPLLDVTFSSSRQSARLPWLLIESPRRMLTPASRRIYIDAKVISHEPRCPCHLAFPGLAGRHSQA